MPPIRKTTKTVAKKAKEKVKRRITTSVVLPLPRAYSSEYSENRIQNDLELVRDGDKVVISAKGSSGGRRGQYLGSDGRTITTNLKDLQEAVKLISEDIKLPVS